MVSDGAEPLGLSFDSFHANLSTGELRKGDRLAKLQPQPFKLLVLLALRSGELVTREEIQKELWSDDTFVDFEHGINYCIKEIRTALGDDAEKPRFVQTVPRRGYRLIAAVKAEAPELKDEEELGGPSENLRTAKTSSTKGGPRLAIFTVIVIASVIGTFMLTRPGKESGEAQLAPMRGTFTQITAEAGVEYFPSLSPDGKFVVYVSGASGNLDLYIR